MQPFKSPRLSPFSHLINMSAIFSIAVLITFFAEIGAEAGPSYLAMFFASAVAGTIAAAGGAFIAQGTRAAFGLIQAGRLFQYFAFWLSTMGGLFVSALLFPSVVEIHNFGIAGALIVLIGFVSAIALGEVPTKGRTWLPMRMPKK